MPKPKSEVNLRIIGGEENLVGDDKEKILEACKRIGVASSDVRGVCFIDYGAMISLLLDGGDIKVVDMTK